MAKQIIIPSHYILTIRRPDGTVEELRRDGACGQRLFGEMKRATAAAGRGDVLSYVNHTKEVPVPAEWIAADAAERAYDKSTAAIYRAMDHAGNQ